MANTRPKACSDAPALPSVPLRRAVPALAAALWLAGCASNGPAPAGGACQAPVEGRSVVVGSGLPGDPAAPEPASGYRSGRRAVLAASSIVVSANPHASKAGCEVLQAGGSAVDAAVAVQMVLGLVEPQSSGLGGGGFLLHYSAAADTVQAYDGRETAPAAADANDLRHTAADDPAPPQPSARASGRAIGTPGTVRLLELAHREHGRLPWSRLLQPAIALASGGFAISGRLAAAIDGARAGLLADAEAGATYFNADRTPKALGTLLQVPAYAATLSALASSGADAFYTGPIAEAIVGAIGRTAHATTGAAITPGKTTLADLAAYRAVQRVPVCTTYRAYWVCGMPPPSAGGLAVAQTLGMLEHFDLPRMPPDADGAAGVDGGRPQVQAVHLVSEAERLAYADRDRYVADTDFVPLPGGSTAAMTDPAYLRARAALIRPAASMGTAPAGALGSVALGLGAPSAGSGTTHFSIVDSAGNVVAMTSTVESGFGAFHMARGFVLNNQLTDFSAAPADAAGLPIANRLSAGKRPRSAMAPTLVFRMRADGSRGAFVMATGSPGGGNIVQYVVKTLVGVLDWQLDAQQATSMVNFGAANGPTTNIGGEHPAVLAADNGAADPLVQGLRALGHTVSVNAQPSGVATVLRVQHRGAPALQGGADPRREGVVLGDGLRR